MMGSLAEFTLNTVNVLGMTVVGGYEISPKANLRAGSL